MGGFGGGFGDSFGGSVGDGGGSGRTKCLFDAVVEGHCARYNYS